MKQKGDSAWWYGNWENTQANKKKKPKSKEQKHFNHFDNTQEIKKYNQIILSVFAACFCNRLHFLTLQCFLLNDSHMLIHWWICFLLLLFVLSICECSKLQCIVLSDLPYFMMTTNIHCPLWWQPNDFFYPLPCRLTISLIHSFLSLLR